MKMTHLDKVLGRLETEQVVGAISVQEVRDVLSKEILTLKLNTISYVYILVTAPMSKRFMVQIMGSSYISEFM